MLAVRCEEGCCFSYIYEYVTNVVSLDPVNGFSFCHVCVMHMSTHKHTHELLYRDNAITVDATRMFGFGGNYRHFSMGWMLCVFWQCV